MGGEPKAGSSIHLTGKAAIHFVSIEVHKQQQFACQTSTVTGNSLTLSVALLVRHSGTTHYSMVDCHEFTGSQK